MLPLVASLILRPLAEIDLGWPKGGWGALSGSNTCTDTKEG